MPVELNQVGHVAVVVMARPEARNAMNAEMAGEMDEAFDQLTHDDQVWVVVITGSGDRAFCAGQDLKEVGRLNDSKGGTARYSPSGGWGGVTRREFPKPLIAAVNGIAPGGGFEIALSCDLIVAEEHAQFGLPEVKRGVFAGAGGLVRIAHRLAPSVALEMVLTGEPISAQRALDLGLANRVVPKGQGLPAALDLANVICAASPLAVRLAKHVVRTAMGSEEDELFELQSQLAEQLRTSEDFKEGPRAFIEKRAPQWKGR
jgi:enoyl-CoA hydratase